MMIIDSDSIQIERKDLEFIYRNKNIIPNIPEEFDMLLYIDGDTIIVDDEDLVNFLTRLSFISDYNLYNALDINELEYRISALEVRSNTLEDKYDREVPTYLSYEDFIERNPEYLTIDYQINDLKLILNEKRKLIKILEKKED